ncbi:hypothetical protein AYJ54_32520 [Bradyrhizobium centrolobii]|uniref:Uncharacterized protein n=1 Tax=Bradyrhizobium centrolobii TaxID=1505087 RepID=A0A176YAI8_9BRAD|nr:hypothetical protein [Bradyrhizobium centrolobii]OAE99624.1 hypothetical protein AYJ54_32520 [Bradyrhizobium centrolobii]
MIHEHQIDVQLRMAIYEAGNLILIKLGHVCAFPSAPHCSILFSQTDRPSLAPFDDQGYLSF